MTTLIFTVSDFKHCCWILSTHRIIKMQISICTAVDLTALLQKSVVKGVKDFPKWLVVCQPIDDILNIKVISDITVNDEHFCCMISLM